MRWSPKLVLLIALFTFGPLTVVVAGDASTFDAISDHYESIRQALLHDTVDGVSKHAESIRHLAEMLEGGLDARTAGVEADKISDLRELLPGIVVMSRRLADAASLDEGRAAFRELSQAMVSYRQIAVDPSPVVVFCSMAKAVWLQPNGEIGNPYYGQSMARCGEIVSE